MVAVFGAIAAVVTGRVRARHLVVIIPFAIFGFLANRNMYPATMVLIPYAARLLARERTESTVRNDLTAVNWAFVAVFVVWALSPFGFNRPVTLDEARFPPPDARATLEDGQVWHGTAMGGYLIYAEWPERLVFIDDRAELFGEAGFRAFHDQRIGEMYQQVFADLGIRQAIVETDWDLGEALLAEGWTILWEDEHHQFLASG